MKKLFLTITVLFIAISMFATTYYVSPTGNDLATGRSKTTAWKTIARVNSQIFVAGDNIYFKRGGIYTGTLNIGRSGTSAKRITYSAYDNGARPKISGFTTVTGWTNEGGGIYSKVINPASAPNMLTINGVQYAMGRYPNTGQLVFESYNTNISITDNQLTGTPNWTGAEMVLYTDGYSIDRCLITNHVTTTLTYTNLGSNRVVNVGGAGGNGYFIQNDVRTLDQYGEWHYNSSTKKLSVYFGGIVPTTKTTKVSTIDNLVTNTGGRDYITIRNIDFEGANKTAIRFTSGTDYAKIEGCNITFSGSGVTLYGSTPNVLNNSISHINGYSEVNDARSGAIYTLGTNAVIKGNDLHDIGVIVGQAYRLVYSIPIVANGGNTLIEYNAVDNCAYMGIYTYTDATNTIIRYNFVNKPSQLRDDSGGIYTGGTNHNYVIENNIVTNSGGNGIYIDNYAENTKAIGNTVYNSYRHGMFINMGNHDSLIDNKIYKNGTAGINIENWYNTYYLHDNYISGNIVVADTLQYVAQLINRYTGTKAVGVLSNNTYVLSKVDSTRFITNLPTLGQQYKKFSQWKTTILSDNTSQVLPLVAGDNVIFQYNATKVNKTIHIGDSARDVSGNWYVNTTVVIPPFESILLFEK